MQWIIPAIIISYLAGSIPTAFLYGRIFKKVDIRKHGSGNIGATNALRVFGKKAGILVLLLDIVKGVLPVVIIGDFVLTKESSLNPDLLRILLGLSCVIGHNWTVFLNFKGGKGVATTLGVMLGLSLKINGFGIILLLLVIIWFLSFLVTRIVSVASLLVAVLFPALTIALKTSPQVTVFSVIFSLFIILRHIPNIKRLLKGEEPRLSFKKSR